MAEAGTGKLDLYRQFKHEYAARKTPSLVEIAPAKYLTIAGRGEPNSDVFAAAVGTIYPVAFTIKMTRKFAGLGDYKVCHLEGLWWAEDPGRDFTTIPRDRWLWEILIRVPDFIQQADLDAAGESLRRKGKAPQAGLVRLQTIDEGLCVQALHVGPYATEPQTIAAMAKLAAQNGLTFRGRHHEIYLSDPRRAAPERLRTILRHPVRRA